MPYDGSGNYSLPAPETPFISGTAIQAADMNTVMTDLAQALSLCLTRDSQATPSASFNFGGQRGINVGAPTAVTDVASRGFVVAATVDRDLAGFRMTNVPTVPVAGTDAVNADFVNTAQANRSMGGFSLTNLPAIPSVGSEAVSRDYVLGLSNNLPLHTGNAGKVLQTNGAAASWQLPPALTLYSYQNSGGL